MSHFFDFCIFAHSAVIIGCLLVLILGAAAAVISADGKRYWLTAISVAAVLAGMPLLFSALVAAHGACGHA